MGFLQKKEKQQVALQTDTDTDYVIEREGFLKYRFKKAVKKTKREEFVRMTLNYQIVSVLSWFNIAVLLPIALFSWIMTLFGQFELAVLNFLPWWLFIPLWALPYFTWHYSTITIPQKKGPVILKDWSKTKKGRWKAAIFNLAPLHVLSWCAFAKYIVDYFLGYLTSVKLVEPYKGIVMTDNLNSFILILFVVPIIFSALAIFLQSRDYMINKDLLKTHFMTWEAPYIRKYAHEYKLDSCDVIVGFDIETKKPIIIKENERFLHEAIIGATGSGKTSTTLLLRIAQDILKIATGQRDMGLIFLEPKGDGVNDVLTICKKLGVPDEKIKVIDPTKSWSMKYNPFGGTRESAASGFQGTLNALTGDQDEFFKGQQNEAASTYTLLAKIRFGPATNILHIQQMFTDPRYLADIVEFVRKTIDSKREDPSLTSTMRAELNSFEQVVAYFENEVLDYKTFRDKEEIKQVLYPPGHKYGGRPLVENKKDKFVTGAKKYLNEIALNSMLKSLFVCNDGEEAFDADKFLKEGGVVLVNTALGDLDELSLLFGQFFIRQFQSAVFRRAQECKETGIERIPIMFYVDEFPLFANEAFERFLTLGRSYKVGAVIAMQSIAQLDAVGLSYRKSVMGNASHKTVFGRGPVEDNEYFSKEFGEELKVVESMNESGSPMTSEKQTWGYRINTQKELKPRFSPTDIRELPFKEMIVQVVNERNSIGIPKHAVGQFVHESAFINRFMDLAANEIKSTEEKEFNVTDHVAQERIDTLIGNVKTGYESLDHLSENEILNLTDFHSVIPDEFMANVSAIGESVQKEFEQQVVKNDDGFMAPPLQSQAIPVERSENSHNNVIPFPITDEPIVNNHSNDGHKHEHEEDTSISIYGDEPKSQSILQEDGGIPFNFEIGNETSNLTADFINHEPASENTSSLEANNDDTSSWLKQMGLDGTNSSDNTIPYEDTLESLEYIPEFTAEDVVVPLVYDTDEEPGHIKEETELDNKAVEPQHIQDNFIPPMLDIDKTSETITHSAEKAAKKVKSPEPKFNDQMSLFPGESENDKTSKSKSTGTRSKQRVTADTAPQVNTINKPTPSIQNGNGNRDVNSKRPVVIPGNHSVTNDVIEEDI
ncbi:type IV secretory system conjugative DNA transfer family protein [Lysinibacillus xylanilyticus]|uniref:Conjugation protein, TraG/TraD family n=1 Tax=Lysinibacillus xylanilyticus TaxID=582475 RepID=A0A2M9QA67_9BACI|nr:type IV secretory system conjugative DNA transfer family protein [Lysinibacillus xylanilyticus]PJO44912.1 conjugation protein, TraG/TraD family [Lysinibacillus xylanilyticus]